VNRREPGDSVMVEDMAEPAADAWTFEGYLAGDTALPSPNLGWNTYGTGVESIGREGLPEEIEVGDPGPDQLLIRIDAVGLCFSDVKLIRLGGDHPKLYGRDLACDPIRLGHEASVTVIEVGEALRGRYSKGDRLAIQPDIYVDGRATSYGYTIPGGLVQYHLIGPEVLDADDGAYVIGVPEGIGYAAAALSEPWACVEAAYTQRRRLWPKPGGSVWVIGKPDDATVYDYGKVLAEAASVVVTGLSAEATQRLAEAAGDARLLVTEPASPSQYASLSDEMTGGEGFDDIVVLDPTCAETISSAARCIAFRGTMAMIGRRPLDGLPEIDFGRLHYDYTAYLGTRGPDVSAAYGEQRNRCELRPGGLTVFVGAGGPMGQMHVQRAIESDSGPATLLAIDLDENRLSSTMRSLEPLARSRGRTLIAHNTATAAESDSEVVARLSGGRGADDVVVTVPLGPVMADAARLMSPDGMLVFFAGVANGTMGPLDMSRVYLDNAQFTGTSGSTISDQALVVGKAQAGKLSPALNVAAIGGIEAARDGVQAMLDGRFAGKIVIFPQVSGVPLLGLDELADELPEVAESLGPRGEWTSEAERRLIESRGRQGR